MTSEIALMNRRAVALAADSATTVTYLEGGKRNTRYVKGTNKLFNLSGAHPVALMTYASGTLQRIPWEVVIKAFRDQLRDKSFPTLKDYATSFFDYISTNKRLLDPAFQLKQFLADIRETAGLIAYMGSGRSDFHDEPDDDKKRALVDKHFPRIKKAVGTAKFIDGADDDFAAKLIKERKQEILEDLPKDSFITTYLPYMDLGDLADLAIVGLLKKPFTALEATGLVFAGFGDHDYFPQLAIYSIYGIVFDRMLCECTQTKSISQENVSEIVPIAQSEMAKGFMSGLNPTMLDLIEKKFVESVDAFDEDLRKAKHIPDTLDLDALKNTTRDRFNQQLTADLKRTHTIPMRRVVGVLPIDELAELAEILVRMESLKERVTRDSEEVGGPIDVAVISKGDGFIWIKRKHYFEPKMNPRFFSRRGMLPHE